MTAPIFYFDFSSPYSYLAAMRIDDLLPTAEWRPIAFGVVVQRIGKTPWSFGHDKSVTQALIDHRALDRGLPPLRYPEGWPKHTYSVAPLRAYLTGLFGATPAMTYTPDEVWPTPAWSTKVENCVLACL